MTDINSKSLNKRHRKLLQAEAREENLKPMLTELSRLTVTAIEYARQLESELATIFEQPEAFMAKHCILGTFWGTPDVKEVRPDLNTPWSLHFDRDGTEDSAIICDADGEELVRSRHFWLPAGDDPVPPTLAAMRVMVAAPKLIAALDYLLEQSVDMDLKHGITLTEGEAVRQQALAVITETAGRVA